LAIALTEKDDGQVGRRLPKKGKMSESSIEGGSTPGPASSAATTDLEKIVVSLDEQCQGGEIAPNPPSSTRE
jgi:hypothetical protein